MELLAGEGTWGQEEWGLLQLEPGMVAWARAAGRCCTGRAHPVPHQAGGDTSTCPGPSTRGCAPAAREGHGELCPCDRKAGNRSPRAGAAAGFAKMKSVSSRSSILLPNPRILILLIHRLSKYEQVPINQQRQRLRMNINGVFSTS